MLENLNRYQILLASKSPRRRELLEMIRIPFTTVCINGIKEEYPSDLNPELVPGFLSELKADAYQNMMKENELIITADTVVISEGQILGKPTDAEDAKKMLRRLAGKPHLVVTGVTVAVRGRRETISSTSKVVFGPLTDEEIDYYVENFTPLDKAGAYGIQEWIGAVAVERIEGSFYNVMGLPIHRLYNLLKTF